MATRSLVNPRRSLEFSAATEAETIDAVLDRGACRVLWYYFPSVTRPLRRLVVSVSDLVVSCYLFHSPPLHWINVPELEITTCFLTRILLSATIKLPHSQCISQWNISRRSQFLFSFRRPLYRPFRYNVVLQYAMAMLRFAPLSLYSPQRGVDQVLAMHTRLRKRILRGSSRFLRGGDE